MIYTQLELWENVHVLSGDGKQHVFALALNYVETYVSTKKMI